MYMLSCIKLISNFLIYRPERGCRTQFRKRLLDSSHVARANNGVVL